MRAVIQNPCELNMHEHLVHEMSLLLRYLIKLDMFKYL